MYGYDIYTKHDIVITYTTSCYTIRHRTSSVRTYDIVYDIHIRHRTLCLYDIVRQNGRTISHATWRNIYIRYRMSYTRCRIQGYDIVHTYDTGHTISYAQNPYVVHTISYVRYTARCRIHDVRRRVTGRTISYVAYDIVGGKNPDVFRNLTLKTTPFHYTIIVTICQICSLGSMVRALRFLSERLPVLIQEVWFCPSGESAPTLFKSSESKLTLSNKQAHRVSETFATIVSQRIFLRKDSTTVYRWLQVQV